MFDEDLDVTGYADLLQTLLTGLLNLSHILVDRGLIDKRDLVRLRDPMLSYLRPHEDGYPWEREREALTKIFEVQMSHALDVVPYPDGRESNFLKGGPNT